MDVSNPDPYRTKSELKEIWVDSLNQWMLEWACQLWIPFYINMMFKPLPKGSPNAVLARMRRAIEREFYSNFFKKFVRHSTPNTVLNCAPKLILFPDLPVPKRNKDYAWSAALNQGLHYNGIMMIPTLSRNKSHPQTIIDGNQHKYYAGDIERIVATRMDTPEKCIDYAAKTILARRVDQDHVFLLPRSVSEVRSTSIKLDPISQQVRELISRFNISEENARAILSDKQ